GQFGGALQDDDVDVGVPQPFRGHLDDRVGPVEGAGAAEAVGPAVGGDGDDVGVGALHEGRGPRPVHVPEQDPHATSTSLPTAATPSSAVTPSRDGGPGTGRVRARVPALGAFWSPSSTQGTP